MPFETERANYTIEYLKRYFDNADVGMTYDKYIQMCEQFGDEIDWDKIPPDYMDFPSYVHAAMNIFNALPDNYTSTMEHVIFTGKDYASLPILFELYNVPPEDRLLVLDVVQFIDSRTRKKAVEAAKKKKS